MSTAPSTSSSVAIALSQVPVGSVAARLLAEPSVVLHGLSWSKYQTILAGFGDQGLRHTYSEGTLEIMSPSQRHEWESEFLCRLIQQMCYERDQDILSLGSWTLGNEFAEKGLEPDKCFYIGNEPAVRFNEEIDLDKDPPPDLAIEIDVTSSSVKRLPVYAAIGVPEIWRYDGQEMHFLQLGAGTQTKREYQPIDRSVSFPFLAPAKLKELLDARHVKTELKLVKEFVTWVRQQ